MMSIKLILSRLNPFKKKFVLTKSSPPVICPVLDAKINKEKRIVEVVEAIFLQASKEPSIDLDQVLLDIDGSEASSITYIATCCYVIDNKMNYIFLYLDGNDDIESKEFQNSVYEAIQQALNRNNA